jgi:hypothetical protein
VLALDVAINGKRHCLAGVGNRGILSAFVTYYRIRLEEAFPDLGPKVHLHVSGTRGDGARVHWPPGASQDATVPLRVGDVVTIRVVETDVADPGRQAQ